MAIFKERFSREDLILLLVYTAFPIHVWTIVNMLTDVPSWALYMRTWELVGMVAYTLSFALFETILILFPVFLVGLILPKGWIDRVFVPWVGVMLLEGALVMIAFQVTIVNHSPKRLLVVMAALLLGLSTILVIKFPRIGEVLRSLAGRLAILTVVYIFLDVLGLLIVLVRNL